MLPKPNITQITTWSDAADFGCARILLARAIDRIACRYRFDIELRCKVLQRHRIGALSASGFGPQRERWFVMIDERAL